MQQEYETTQEKVKSRPQVNEWILAITHFTWSLIP